MKKGIVYLACPYSDAIGPVRETRAQIANRVAGDLIRKGHVVYSPISHCHEIAKECNLNTTWENWKEFDEAFLSLCSEMRVIKIPGWKNSRGVKMEMEIAQRLNMPIKFINLADLEGMI